MSKEKSITESEAEKIIKENEDKIDGTKQRKKEEEEKKMKEDKQNNQEGFIGTNSDPNRSPTDRVVNTVLMGLNVLAMAMLFLWIPSYLWVVLNEYKKSPGYSGNQVSGTDPFKPPYVAKAPSGVSSPSAAEMESMGFFDTRKFGWPYTMASATDDVGDGDFALPNEIWANHIRDIFHQGRNMFDTFLDIFKSMVGTIPPSLNPNIKQENSTWGDVFKTFFGVFWVFALTIMFILVGTGVAASMLFGRMIGIPFIAAVWASVITMTDGIRKKECKDKALGFLFSKLWWHGENEEGWLAAPNAKIWRLLYRGILLFFMFPINSMIATYILPLYGFYWLFGRYMPQTNKAVWYIVKRLIGKYFIPLTIFILLGLAGAGNKEMYPAWFKVSPMFWKGGPSFKGSFKNIHQQSADWYWGLGKKILVGYPYVLGMVVILLVIINLFKSVLPWSTKGKPPKAGEEAKPKEFILPQNEMWYYTGANHTKYGMDGWTERWKKQLKEGLILKPPCGGPPTGSSRSSSGGKAKAQGMVFNAGMKALGNQPGVKLAKTLNMAANNPNIAKPAALGAVALAGAAGMGGAAGNVMNTMNKANNIRNAIKQVGGRRSKSRRRRRKR
jgi:hypothetical protein